MKIRAFRPHDSFQLQSFECSFYREPWTLAVQEMIRDRLPYSLVTGEARALGAWDRDTLCGVAAWTTHEHPIWRSSVVAVQRGYYRRGIGEALKHAVLEEARRAGATALVSFIHYDNDRMLRLNTKLGAHIERDPRDRNYFVCTIQP